MEWHLVTGQGVRVDIKGRLLMPAHSNWLMMSLVSGNVCAMGPLGSRHIGLVAIGIPLINVGGRI